MIVNYTGSHHFLVHFALKFTVLFCLSQTAVFSEEMESFFEDGSIESQIRFFTIKRDYKEFKKNSEGNFKMPYRYQRSSTAIGGYLGVKTGNYYGFSAGATLYTSQPVFHNPPDEGGLLLLKNDQSGYSVLGEAYLKWEKGKTLVKVGRQRLSQYGFLSDCDVRMTPYTYEAAVIENRDLSQTVLRAGVVRGVKTVNDTAYIDFVNASKNLLIENPIERNPIRGDYNPAYYDTDRNYIGPKKNLYLASAVYNDIRYHAEVWDYYVPDFVNFLYVQGSYRFTTESLNNEIMFMGIKQDDVGNHVAGSINTWAYGIAIHSHYRHNVILGAAYTKVKYDENSLDGGTIIDSWGNGLLYNSLFYNGGDQAGTNAYSLSVSYLFDFADLKVDFTAGFFDLPNKLTDLYADQDNREYDLILTYKPRWNSHLHFKLVGIYVDFDTDYDYRAYEKYHGYQVLHMYDNVVDTRLVVNYTF